MTPVWLTLATSKMPGMFYRDFEVADAPVTVDFELAVIEAPRGKVLVVAGKDVPRVAFDVPRSGKNVRVTVKDAEGVMTQVARQPMSFLAETVKAPLALVMEW